MLVSACCSPLAMQAQLLSGISGLEPLLPVKSADLHESQSSGRG